MKGNLFKKIIFVCMTVFLLSVVSIPTTNFGIGVVTAEAATTVKLNKRKTTIYVGKTEQLKVKGTKSKVKWSSNKKSVATVSSKGKVKGKKAGTAIITAKVGNKKYKCKVTVKSVFSVNTKKVTIKDDGKIYMTINHPYASVTSSVSDTNIIEAGFNPAYNGGKKHELIIIAKKDGKATITLKNNINSEKIVINVTVSGHKEPIQYIGDRSVDYNSTYKEHRLFFSLMPADQTKRVASSGVAKIRIVNDDNVEVFNKQIQFNESNFSNWSNISGTKYLCCLKISESELTKSSSTKGKLTFSVALTGGETFDDYSISVDNLPLQDLRELCKITLPTIPMNFSYLNSINNKTICSANVTEIDYYSAEKRYDGKYIANIKVSGVKTYDKDGDNYSRSCEIGYKLYDDDLVVRSGEIYTTQISVGEKFEYKLELSGLEKGSYRLELLDVN